MFCTPTGQQNLHHILHHPPLSPPLSNPWNQVHHQILVTTVTVVAQALQRTQTQGLREYTSFLDLQTSYPPAYRHTSPHTPSTPLPLPQPGSRAPPWMRPGALETTWRLCPSWCPMVRNWPCPPHCLTTLMMMMMGGTGSPTTLSSLPVPTYPSPPANLSRPPPTPQAFLCTHVPPIWTSSLPGMRTTTWKT